MSECSPGCPCDAQKEREQKVRTREERQNNISKRGRRVERLLRLRDKRRGRVLRHGETE